MQYNPGAVSLKQYATAAAMHTRGAHDSGGRIIHETSPELRSKYARQIAAIKRHRGTDRFRENPQAQSYLKAAETAAKSGQYEKAMRLLKKYARTKRIELAADDKRKRNSNSKEEATQLYKDFHGKESTEVLRLQDALLKAGDYTALGNDPEFWLEPVSGDPRNWPAADIEFQPRDKVKLATDAKGKRLYIVGGNQKMPVKFLKDKDSARGRIFNLGTCYGISYQTEKVFDDFQTTTYAHEFGEETGERPELHYDSAAARLLLVGGAYHIAGVEKALKASPGIVN